MLLGNTARYARFCLALAQGFGLYADLIWIFFLASLGLLLCLTTFATIQFFLGLFTNYASQYQGQPRDKQGQAGTRQGQTGTSGDIPFLSLLVPTCPCLSLSVHACPCLSLPVPVGPCLSLYVPVCLYIRPAECRDPGIQAPFLAARSSSRTTVVCPSVRLSVGW